MKDQDHCIFTYDQHQPHVYVRLNSEETHSLRNSRLDSSTLASNESKSYKDVDGAFPGTKNSSLLVLHKHKNLWIFLIHSP